MSIWNNPALTDPWNDQIDNSVSKWLPNNSYTTESIDTRNVDYWRQGRELQTPVHFFGSGQPKIWGGKFTLSGTIDHTQDINVVGQSRTIIEYENEPKYYDLPEFSMVDYIKLGNDYPFPIYFNNGPQDNEEAAIQVFSIMDKKKPDIEGRDRVNGMKAELMEGSPVNGRLGGVGQFSSYRPYDSLVTRKPFLDEGEIIFGQTLAGSVIYPGYVSDVEDKDKPYKDTTIEEVILEETLRANSSNGLLTSSILQMQYNNSIDERPLRSRSVTSGYSFYGPGSGALGSDSIAFGNRKRGS